MSPHDPASRPIAAAGRRLKRRSLLLLLASATAAGAIHLALPAPAPPAKTPSHGAGSPAATARGGAAAASRSFDLSTHAIVVTQIPLDAAPGANAHERGGAGARGVAGAEAPSFGMLPAAWGERARIMMIGPGPRRRILTEGFHSAADPEISFDGKRMLFAAQRAAGDRWRIYEMDLDSRSVRMVTPEGAAAPARAPSAPPEPGGMGSGEPASAASSKPAAPSRIVGDVGPTTGPMHDADDHGIAAPGAGGKASTVAGASGGNAAPIDHRSPLYEGVFYVITAKEPWSIFSFVGTAPDQINELGSSPLTALYSARLDGSEIQRLTWSPSSALTPAVLPDGRLAYAQWQRGTLDRGWEGRVALFAANTDGLDASIFSGDEGRRVKLMPCVTADRRVIFVEGDRVPWDGSGSLASVDLRRNLHSYRPLTKPGAGLFHSPSPLPDGTILVSRRGDDGRGSHGVFRLDPRTGRLDPVFDDPAYHDVQAKVVAPRPEPDGRSSVLTTDNPNGTFYGLDVFTSDVDRSRWIRPGEPWRLRVLEGIPRRPDGVAALPVDALNVPLPGATPEGIPPLLRRRFLGEVAIESDGSFNVQVPADTPVQMQIVDADGLAVRTCDWIWARNRETRGCIGCHEDGERAPENQLVQAVRRPSMDLCLPPDRRRTVDFRRDVLPILQRRCSVRGCHEVNGEAPMILDDAPGRMVGASGRPLFDRAYESLLAPPRDRPLSASSSLTRSLAFASNRPGAAEGGAASSPYGIYVHPGRARTSPLVWHLLGRVTSRPWDPAGDAARAGSGSLGTRPSAATGEVDEGAGPPPRAWKRMPPDGSIPLTDDERRTIIEWIDLGALWSGIPPDARAAVPSGGSPGGSP